MTVQAPIDYRGKTYLPVSISSPDDISADPVQVTITPNWNAHQPLDDPSYRWMAPLNIQGIGWAVLLGPGGFELVRGEMYAVLAMVTDDPGPEVPVLSLGVFSAT